LLSRNIFFPIETIKRELDYKMLLACLVLEKNQEVIIAQHDRIEKIMLKSNNGVYIGKNIMKNQRTLKANNDEYSIFNKVKKNNISIVFLDEEGGVYAGGPNRIKEVLGERLDVNILHSDDLVCTWGDFQSEYYNKRLNTNNDCRVMSTGHIKFEFTKSKYFGFYKEKSDEYLMKYGSYILIDTHFSYANNAYGISDTFTIRHGYGPTIKEKLKLTEYWADEQIKIAYFVTLAKKISVKFPELNIIFRPHPSEDFNYYNSIFSKIDNVFVNNEGEVVPWILGAKCLIHDHCTTSIEAHMMKVPVINYAVNNSQKHDSYLTKMIGTKCESENEVLNCIKDIIIDDENYKGINYFGENQLSLLSNLRKRNPNDLVTLIKDVIKLKSSLKESKLSYFQLIVMESLYSLFLFIKKPIRKLFFKDKQKSYEADLVAFDGFKNEEIDLKLKKISKILDKKFKLKFLSERVFIIEKK
jgi:surface carbohydrate biosynthesis protein